MDDGTWGCGDELVALLSRVSEVLVDLPVSVCRLTGAELDAVVGAVDRLAAVAAAGRFTLAAEADARGEVEASSPGRCGDGWPTGVRRWTPGRWGWWRRRCRAGRAAAGAGAGGGAAGRLSVAAGAVVASEMAQLRPLLEAGAEGPVLAGLVEIGVAHGCAGVRGLRPALLARYGLGVVIQEEQDRRAGLTQLSCGHDIGGGITEYRMRLTPESRAVVEAALNALTRPAVVDGVP